MAAATPGAVRPTLGMVFLGCVAALFALILLTLSATLPPRGAPGFALFTRVAFALLGVLAAVAAEALCFARPWAARALTTWFVTGIVAVAGPAWWRDGSGGWGVTLALTLLTLLVLLPLLRYVHDHVSAPVAQTRFRTFW